MSRGIAKFQKYTGAPESCYDLSHLAGVYREPPSRQIPYCQESTTGNKKWSAKSGTQMNNFALWLKMYPGRVWARKLSGFNRSKSFYKADALFWLRHRGRKYESGIPGAIELGLCGLRLHRHVRRFFPNYVPKFTDELHCTELQAKRLHCHGLIRSSTWENKLPPWVWFSEIDKHLLCKISKLYRIK